MLPVVRELAPLVPVSVDTFRPEVARAAVAAGAAVINDTTGLHDPAMADVVADERRDARHRAQPRGSPARSIPQPHYDDVAPRSRHS